MFAEHQNIEYNQAIPVISRLDLAFFLIKNVAIILWRLQSHPDSILNGGSRNRNESDAIIHFRRQSSSLDSDLPVRKAGVMKGAFTMLLLFQLIVAAAFGAIIAAGVLAPNRNSAKRVVGLILALALFFIGAVFFWENAIVAFAIAAVYWLARGVRLQMGRPPKALGGAREAFVLLFVLSWLTLQAADLVHLGPTSSDLSRMVYRLTVTFPMFGRHNFGVPEILTALGIACLLAACFLERRLKIIAVFFGALLLLLFGSTVLERFLVRDLFYGRGPGFKLAVLFAIVVGILGIARLLRKARKSKNP
jgi:hypothetical protein